MGHAERARLRRRFDRLSGQPDPAGEVERLVGERLLEHLDPIRLAPGAVLELGSGRGELLAGLATRYPKALLYGIDLSAAMAGRAARRRLGWRRRARIVQADAERVPLRGAAFDLVVTSNLLPWCEPRAVIAECARLLAEGGLLLLATPGPDTLRELRDCAIAHDGRPRVVPFLDLHDLGDALVGGGFTGVVAESERLTLLYRDLAHLHAELRGLGAAGLPEPLHRGLGGRRWAQALARGYEPLRRDGRLPVSYEVLYAHAWRGGRRPQRSLEVSMARRRVAR